MSSIKSHLAISFRPLVLNTFDMTLLFTWLHTPHVAKWWGELPEDLEDTFEEFEETLTSPECFPYIIERGGSPFGYIQAYDAYLASDGWWENEPEGTWGMDLFIGDGDRLNQGIGTEIICRFAHKIVEEYQASRIIVDPRPDNTRAIRAYKRAGFREVGKITTPDGAAQLLEMIPQAGHEV